MKVKYSGIIKFELTEETEDINDIIEKEELDNSMKEIIKEEWGNDINISIESKIDIND
ncbi:MAG: hypothetical protein [Bacteriophage sp.]|nr:MAG: hypothetical protein [Bacteriophage sp.]